MGVAASLFFSSNSDKETLHRRVRPTDEQSEDQTERWNDLRDAVIADLKQETGLPMRSWLQGSYKFTTQIRPVGSVDEFDIDVGLYFEWEGKPSDGKFSPSDLKGKVQAALKRYAKGCEDVREVVEPAKERCSRARYDGKFHIDIPVYHLDASKDMRALATASNKWEGSDPKALYLWFKDLFDAQERQKVCRYIRYFKTWAALKLKEGEGRPPSVMLTVLIAEAAESIGFDTLGSDDDAVYLIAKEVSDRLAGSFAVNNPVDDDEDLAARFAVGEQNNFIDALETFVKIASRATDAADMITAADEWSKAFEHVFPMPDEEELTESLSKGTLVPLIHVPEISVVAKAKNNSSYTKATQNGIGPIPKDCAVTFTVTNSWKFPTGTVFEWMVRNQGREADSVNDLGHRVLAVGPVATEHSAYNGTHYMDCIAKYNGRIVGFRRVPVIIQGPAIPARNPPRKVHFRGRG